MAHQLSRMQFLACLALPWACARTSAEARRPDARPTPNAPNAPAAPPAAAADAPYPPVGERLTLTEAQWRQRLTPEQFHILREQGTEAPFHNAYWDNHARGTYVCAGCGAPLFGSDAKFESGTGWPSFYQPVERGRVDKVTDESSGMTRDEVHCARCGGHLGHVFDDGPQPTGLRYCIDSASLAFRAAR